MRRRILLAILGTVALALVLSTVGTYLLLSREAVRSTEAQLRAEAESLAALIDVSRNPQLGGSRQQRVVAGLRLEGISVLAIGPAGVLRGNPPEGVALDDLDATALREGTTLSGRHDGLLWAAASVPTQRGAIVVALTRSSEPPAPPFGWFLLGGGLALAVAAGVAWWVSGDLTRPLRRAHEATGRIAAGDLGARLPEPARGDRTEVADLTRSLNAMAAALDDSRGRDRQFLLSVSHDLRTPLTSIRGYADAIADGTATDPAAAARIIGSESQRLGRLVGDLLDLARLDAHTFAMTFQVLPVAEIAIDTAEGFRPTAEAMGVELVVTDESAGATARMDPDRLAQAVANLVENGLRYASARLWVAVSRDAAGGTVITVVDDGPGISRDHLPHLFERLYAADRRPVRADVDLGGSSGLGLAIVHDLLAAMGGAATATSPALEDSSGARFDLRLPPPGPAEPPGPA